MIDDPDGFYLRDLPIIIEDIFWLTGYFNVLRIFWLPVESVCWALID